MDDANLIMEVQDKLANNISISIMFIMHALAFFPLFIRAYFLSDSQELTWIVKIIYGIKLPVA